MPRRSTIRLALIFCCLLVFLFGTLGDIFSTLSDSDWKDSKLPKIETPKAAANKADKSEIVVNPYYTD